MSFPSVLMSCWEAVWKIIGRSPPASGKPYGAVSTWILLQPEKPQQQKRRSTTPPPPFSLRLAQYVLEHYDQDLSLKTLAVHFKGNAAYIGQIFKRDMHKSFSDYLKDVRMEKRRSFWKTAASAQRTLR